MYFVSESNLAFLALMIFQHQKMMISTLIDKLSSSEDTKKNSKKEVSYKEGLFLFSITSKTYKSAVLNGYSESAIMYITSAIKKEKRDEMALIFALIYLF